MGNSCCSESGAGTQAVATGTNNGLAGEFAADADNAVDNYYRSRGSNGLYSRIELSLSASKLKDRDILSKSDPMAILYAKKKDGKLEELGRTEVILNSLDPVWVEKINVTYLFEVVQPLVIRIYDIDSEFHNIPVKMLRLGEQQFLGEASCVLSEVITKSAQTLTLDLKVTENHGVSGSKKLGQVTMHAEECITSKTVVEMTLRCADLDNKDFLSKSDPFLIISRMSEGGMSIPVCKTEVKKNDLCPVWNPIVLSLQQVSSKDNPLSIDCYDFNSNGKHSLIGKMRKSLADLERLYNGKCGENFHLPSSANNSMVLKGQLFVDEFHETVRFSFLDYIAGGCEINFMVAIDFTASNGNPRLPDSLHYIDQSGRPNAYQTAIIEVGEVLQFYDTDKRFPAWGFGARPIDGPVSHCFNLNGSRNYSEVDGIHGIMSAYTSALYNVSLAGPTLFGPVINTAAAIANDSLSSHQQKYFVLLIITDGVVTDLQETKEAIVKASDLPLSILIVGVGGADYKDMEILDADKGEKLQSYTGRHASRDIVQFVPMREVQRGETSMVQSLLAELPGQFLSYMKNRGLQPNGVNDIK